MIKAALFKPRCLKALGLVVFSMISPLVMAFDYFVVNHEAEVYSAPDSSELLTRLGQGSVLLEIDKKGSWSRVFFLSADKQPLKGWMLSSYLTAQQQGQSEPVAEGQRYSVTVSSLRLRQGPGSQYGVVGSLSLNQQVTELQRQDEWVKVQYRNRSGHNAEAWTAVRFLRSVGSSGAQQPASGSGQPAAGKQNMSAVPYQISGRHVNFRSGPGTGFAVVGQVSAPQRVEVVGQQKGWMKINVDQGETTVSGWISQRFLKQVR
ncbi:SH3 domain-containing protein [Amphritea atlantica]|uniref:SH3 domain-containing protein n=1 Tax=Amphritea atlantica TaxID=355243 RepID=A0A1H9DDY5_9GAMM|nr:SH3 domain-containing protein [Amphritea atlantica]SEQ11762.1 SH3 domain-containing protein [Amphritea atlantica]